MRCGGHTPESTTWPGVGFCVLWWNGTEIRKKSKQKEKKIQTKSGKIKSRDGEMRKRPSAYDEMIQTIHT